MSDPPNGVGPRGTLPLGVCPVYPSQYATRHAERELRETVRPRALGHRRPLRQEPDLPFPARSEWGSVAGSDIEPAAVEPHRSAQGAGSVARASRAPALRAPMRLRGRWPAVGAILIAVGAIGVVVVVLTRSAHHELPELRQEAELRAAAIPTALRMPEPAPPIAVTSSPASVPTSTARAASTARAQQHAVPRRAAPVPARTSDIADPWR